MTDSETGSVSELILEADFSFDFKSCFLKKAMDFLRERKKELTESIKYFEIYICFFFFTKMSASGHHQTEGFPGNAGLVLDTALTSFFPKQV